MSTTGVDTVVPGRPEDEVPAGLVALEAANDRKRALLTEAAEAAVDTLGDNDFRGKPFSGLVIQSDELFKCAQVIRVVGEA